jgi:hypothetical protein
MTITVSPIFLFNAERGEPEAAELWDGITDQQLGDWEGEWLPVQGSSETPSRRRRETPLAAKSALELAQENGSVAGNVGPSGIQHRLQRYDPRHDDRRHHNEAVSY